jgi:hypothetical protein
VILDFPEDDPSIVYVETKPNSLYLEEEAELEHYTTVFDHLKGAALSPDKSITYLADMAKKL